MSEQLEDQEKKTKEEKAKAFADKRRKEERHDMVTSIISLVCFLLILIGTPFGIMLARHYNESLVEKTRIQASISQVIKNGASLDIVKDVYADRIITHRMIATDDGQEFYYSYDTPLSKILSDLRKDYYSSQQYVSSDSLYLSHLNEIIDENLSLNPFDGLEEPQIQYFKNLKDHIGDGYDTVQEDVNKIARELENKNKLVSHYLNRSGTSYWLSIIALAISLIVGVIQIRQGCSSSKKSDTILDKIEEIKANK